MRKYASPTLESRIQAQSSQALRLLTGHRRAKRGIAKLSLPRRSASFRSSIRKETVGLEDVSCVSKITVVKIVVTV